MPKGTILFRNLQSESQGEELMLHLEAHYNFHEIPKMALESVPEYNLCIVLIESAFLSVQAKVNWVFEHEMAIEYLDTGGMLILDMSQEENQGWVVIHESTPVYQDSVEHMTDEQLRESIEDLRARRRSSPVKAVRAVKSASPKVSVSEEDKVLAKALSGKSPEEMLELRRKLGLCD